MKAPFAKVVEVDGFQVLAHADKNSDDSPCITISAQCGVGRADLAIGYDDDDAGWNKRDEMMQRILQGEHSVIEEAARSLWEMAGHPDE